MYRIYSEFLKEKYGEKVYKLPINLPISCPNRDGTLSNGGCIYCGEVAAGFESLSNSFSVTKQLKTNMAYIGEKYNAKKFIAYFQNFSNTYMPLPDFEKAIYDTKMDNIVGVDVSTRPDCIATAYLEILKKFSTETNIDIGIELGLQTVNYKTLYKLNRAHGLGEFIEAVNLIKSYGFSVCVHLIMDLPWDEDIDVIESAKIISSLKIDYVKLHSLYIVKNTPLAQEYQLGKLALLQCEDYVRRTVLFLQYLSPEIVIQRLIGRAPERDTIIANFNMSWWKIKDMIDKEMTDNNINQGDKFDYLGGCAVKRFL